MNNQKNDVLTAIKKYIRNVTIGTCTFAFSISAAVVVSNELEHIQKRQNVILTMQKAEEVSVDFTSIRDLIQSEQYTMIETMFAQAIAQESISFKQEAIINENSVAVVASTLDAVCNQKQAEQSQPTIQSTNQKTEVVQQPVVEQTTTESVVQTETVEVEQVAEPTVSTETVEVEQETVSVAVESEYDMLCRIVEAEATGGDIESKMIVANVVLNRVKNPQFPNTIEGVIFQHRGRTYQFSPISDGRFYSVNVTDSTREAVNRAMAGEDNSQGALYFVSPRYGNTSWFDRNLTFLFYYGGHNYYK